MGSNTFDNRNIPIRCAGLNIGIYINISKGFGKCRNNEDLPGIKNIRCRNGIGSEDGFGSNVKAARYGI
jgi:hypothetical protein